MSSSDGFVILRFAMSEFGMPRCDGSGDLVISIAPPGLPVAEVLAVVRCSGSLGPWPTLPVGFSLCMADWMRN